MQASHVAPLPVADPMCRWRSHCVTVAQRAGTATVLGMSATSDGGAPADIMPSTTGVSSESGLQTYTDTVSF